MKNMDLEIVLSPTKELFPILRQWQPPGWLSQTIGTWVQCRLCKGGTMNIVHSSNYGGNVLRYCFACKGTGKMRI